MEHPVGLEPQKFVGTPLVCVQLCSESIHSLNCLWLCCNGQFVFKAINFWIFRNSKDKAYNCPVHLGAPLGEAIPIGPNMVSGRPKWTQFWRYPDINKVMLLDALIIHGKLWHMAKFFLFANFGLYLFL